MLGGAIKLQIGPGNGYRKAFADKYYHQTLCKMQPSGYQIEFF